MFCRDFLHDCGCDYIHQNKDKIENKESRILKRALKENKRRKDEVETEK